MKIGTTRVVLAGIMLVVGCDTKEQAAPPQVAASARPVIQSPVVEVQTSAVPIRVEVTGQVATVYQATLSSRIQGSIDTLLVREGTEVKKGQTLVELDRRDLDAELARATAEVENARAHLQRMEKLYRDDAVSQQEMENATRGYKVAEANRKAVVAQLSYTVVKAPFDGVITEKKVEAGELASPGQPLLRMEDPRALRLEATVAEGDLKSIARGDTIPVVIDALNAHPLTGTVSQILPAGDPQTHTFTVKVDLPATPGLKTGMFGRFQLDKGTSDTLVVPASALVQRGELTGLFVVGADQVSRLRLVKLGRRFDDRAEILSGVDVGEEILLRAAQGLDGAVVEVVH